MDKPNDFGYVFIGSVEDNEVIRHILNPQKNFTLLVKRGKNDYDFYWYNEQIKQWELQPKTIKEL